MPEWMTNLFSLSREISSKVALPVFLTLTLVLFLPDRYVGTLGIDQFRDGFRIWIGVLWVLSLAALLSNMLWALGRFIIPKFNGWRYIRAARGNLRDMTENEKAILRSFIVDGNASIVADMNDGVINLLEHKKIILRSADVSIWYTKFPYIMQPWAREYLEKHKHLLD